MIKTEKAEQVKVTEQLLKKATCKKKALAGMDDFRSLLSYMKKGIALTLEVRWADNSTTKEPLNNFLVEEELTTGRKVYHPIVQANLT